MPRAAWFALGGLALFVSLAVLVAVGATLGIDAAIMSAAPELHGAVGDAIAIVVSQGMGFVGLTIATTLFAAWLAWRRRVPEALLVTGAMVVGFLAMVALKDVFARARPELFPWIDPAAGWSFPSGHTLSNTIFWVLLAVLVQRPWAWATGLAMAFIAGAFRAVAGVHWPSDVLAGWALGAAIVAGAVLVRARWFPRPAPSAITAAS